jgi:FKBP-type peptidyl-prolyl cis-trans isomerase
MRAARILVAVLGLALAAGSPGLLAREAPEPLPPPPDVAAPPADAEATASGLASRVLAPGSGTVHPVPSDLVKVHYTGWTTDGKMFDSSVARDRPVVLPLDKVIAGWTEGVQLMVEGEKRRFWIPARLAYEGKPDKPQGMLVFDVELLEILRVPPPPPNVAEPPADAERSKSGLAWKVLQPGTGTASPGRKGTVRVHYTGWTTDGEMFDSSVAKGTPATFPLDKVIPGWTEGLQLMVEGEKRRFWIPKKLAYRGRPGLPEGRLVFDIELLEVVKE